ncbi:hypothetical protein ABD76_10480 [Paenibacillus dendritiformis]|uniref:thioester reductase domain-containing protein n=1 Tax=Paenibacillus dendritiformis TaxID=130049 RepID=UPI001F55320F|nr:thioester reductase domain-containing protein [Paenibacillus dendritiformis]MBG9792893.1 hypothetical protein [Paenibacillus dendritiformis]
MFISQAASDDRAQDDREERYPDLLSPEKTMRGTRIQSKVLPNGRIAVARESEAGFYREGTYYSLLELERELLEHEHIADAVVARDGEGCIIYWVPNQEDAGTDELSRYIEERLPLWSMHVSLEYIEVRRIPRNVQGETDYIRLEEMMLLSQAELQRMTAALRALPIEDCAIVRSYEEGSQADIAVRTIQAAGRLPAYEAAQAGEPKKAITKGMPLASTGDHPNSLHEVLCRAAASANSLLYIDRQGKEHRQSYAELLAEAKRVAKGLQDMGCPAGEPILLQFDDNRQMLETFWACVLGGYVPVPVAVCPVYKSKNSHTDRLIQIWDFLGKPVIATCSQLYEEVGRLRQIYASDSMRVLSSEDIKRDAAALQIVPGQSGDIALMMFTSGSTGTPKGVQLTHHNLLARSLAVKQHLGLTAEEVSLNWMPLSHVGGLVMFHLLDTLLASSQIHIQTDAVLAEPLRWLDWIEQYRVSVTWAPNFAYSLLNEQLLSVRAPRWDLRHVKYFINGGEPIVRLKAAKFMELLEPCGLAQGAMIPAFGMTELSSGITFSRHFSDYPDSYSFVSVGEPVPGVEVRIADEANHVLLEDEIGEVQIKGATVTPGYFAVDNQRALGFTSDGWFQTGDLGFISDGQLTITGRQKDVIFIHGMNYYAQDIEAAMESVPGVNVSFSAACAVRTSDHDSDQLALFFNPRGIDVASEQEAADQAVRTALKELIAAIRGAVVEHCGINPSYIVPLLEEDFPKTEIGKIKRAQMKEAFEAGRYANVLETWNVPGAWMHHHSVKGWFYQKKWQRAKLGNSQLLLDAKAVILMADHSHSLEGFTERICALGARVIQVTDGSAYMYSGENHFTLSFDNPHHFDRLWNALQAQQLDIHAIVHFLHGGALGQNEPPAETVGRMTKRWLAAAQGLLRNLQQTVRYMSVTQGSYIVGETDFFRAEQAIVPGLMKSLALEAPQLKCRQLDLQAVDAEEAYAVLARELLSPNAQQEVAYRDGERYIPLLHPVAKPSEGSTPDAFVRGGLYVVTGGLGAIGSTVCRWLAEHVDAKLLILGQQELHDYDRHSARVKAWEELCQLSPHVKYRAGSLTDRHFVLSAIREAQAEFQAPLHAIYHLSGALSLPRQSGSSHWDELSEHTVANERFESYEYVFASKVFGTMVLDEVRDTIEPDAQIVVFSSVNGHFGGGSLSAYAAAHSFLEAYCLQAWRRNPRTYCLAWSMWDELGLSARIPQVIRQLSRGNGFEALSAEEGLLSLQHALQQGLHHCMIGIRPTVRNSVQFADSGQSMLDCWIAAPDRNGHSVGHIREAIERFFKDLGRFSLANRVRLFLIDSIPRDQEHQVLVQDLKGNSNARLIAQETASRKITETERILLDLWQSELNRSDLTIHDNFFEFGGNSIRMTKLMFAIRERLKLELPFHALLEAPTVTGLAAKIKLMEEADEIAAKQVNWNNELRLPEELRQRIRQAQSPDGQTRFRHIFLTGATGFLGAYLLGTLLRESTACIYCLVRAQSQQEAATRLVDSLRQYGMEDLMDEQRVIPVAGDLTLPSFGLKDEVYDELSGNIDVVYHNGALVNFSYPYEMLKGPNVTGTLEIVRFATAHHLKPVHYISTLSVFLDYTGEVVHEKTVLRPDTLPQIGYNQSKWVADHLMQSAQREGLPGGIYRIGTAAGDSATGACQELDFVWLLIRLCIELGARPDIDEPLNFIPVDQMARYILALSLHDDPYSQQVYHLHPKQPMLLSELFDWLNRYGYEAAAIPYEEWYQRMESYVLDAGGALRGLYSIFPETLDEQRSLLQFCIYRSEYTLDRLAQLNHPVTPLAEEMFRATIDYLCEVQFLPTVRERIVRNHEQ